MVAAEYARLLFTRPGRGASRAAAWQSTAATLHASLLRAAQGAFARCDDRPGLALDALVAATDGARPHWLTHPQLIEALHELAGAADELLHWDQCTVPASREEASGNAALGLARLGNVALPELLRRQPDWQGVLQVASDAYGMIHFPGCAWSLAVALRTLDDVEPAGDALLEISLDAAHVALRAPGDSAPLVVLSRADFVRLLRGRYGDRWQPTLLRRNANYRVRLQYTARLASTRLEFEPIGPSDAEGGHLGLTGAIVEALVRALAAASPGVHRELLAYVRCIRGFELPALPNGAVGSFSTPLRPGLVGFNVAYDAAGQPRLDPFSFTWLAHELAHTKHYLLDEVAYAQRRRFLENGEETLFVPRYGRALSLRTLFQVPYVHLYEATVFADIAAGGFAALPWKVEGDWTAVGDDLLAEIHEALATLATHAQLSAWGQAVLDRQRALTDRLERGWRATRHAA